MYEKSASASCTGVKDCSVFAITLIIHGEDPCDELYKYENMRKHLFRNLSSLSYSM